MKLLATLLVCLSVNPQVDTVHLDRGIYIGQLPAGTGKLYDNERGLFLGRFDRTVPSGRGVHFRRDGGKYADSFGNGEYDTPAVFRDGTSFFQSYIVPNFHFSESMYNSWAIVHYEFVVGADGKIRDVTILSTTNEEYSKELVKVIRRSPRWHPAMKDGRPVPYTVRKQRAAFNMPQ